MGRPRKKKESHYGKGSVCESGGRWYATAPYRNLDGKASRLVKSGATKEIAEARLKQALKDKNIIDGIQYTDDELDITKDVTLHDIIMIAVKNKFRLNLPGSNKKPLASRTLENYIFICRQLDEYFGDTLIQDVDEDVVTEIFKIFQQGNEEYDIEPRSDSYLNKAFYLIRLILDFAVLNSMMPANPMRNSIGKFEKPKSIVRSQPVRPYTDEEIKQIFRSLKRQSKEWDRLPASERYLRPVYDLYLIMTLMLFTGLRSEEARALKWEDVDFTNGFISINKAITLNFEFEGLRVKKSKAIESVTKNEASIREVRVGPDVLNMFNCVKRYNRDRNLSCDPDEYIFLSWEYKQIYTGSGLQSSINKVLDFDGCDVHIRPHRFRHNTATILEDSGASDHSIGTQLGIKNPNTIRVYTDRGRGIVSRNSNIIENGINKKYKMNL